ncbi:Ig-like domain-containing protein [Pedobacter sp. SYSU D00535]|uniref:Ig-like domain-containing protein n=1 Tax=Pedobacter sp. SYSU D00535 TaxID=2810308 RepID=UPI001A971131|nr:Ig-like domain-containing protein [Pedobacter sp. SYSU D00535]
MSNIIRDTRDFGGGGMDLDSAPEFISSTDYREAFNLRNTGTGEGETGYLTNINSTDPISLTLPSGINKTVGCEKFEAERKAYIFRFNSSGRHTITEFDSDTNEQTILFTNRNDSGGKDIFPLTSDTYVNDIKLVDGKFLFFLNGRKEPCCLNLERLKSGSLGMMTKDDFLVIRKPPIYPPQAIYANDPTRPSNLFRGKLLQYRTQFTYLDEEPSAWSPISNRPLPEEESTPAIGTNATKNNCHIVRVNIGDIRVKTVKIAAREGNYDWFLVREVERTHILSLPANLDIAEQVYEAYDPSQNTYSFVFFNDGLYSNIDPLETDLAYDAVPRESATLEILNGKILALGNNRHGYLRPDIDVKFSPSFYDPHLIARPANQSTALSYGTPWERAESTVKQRYYRVEITWSGIAKQGDYIRINIHNLDNVPLYYHEHTVIASEDGNTLKAIQSLATKIPNAAVQQVGDKVILKFSTPRKNEDPNPDQTKHLGNIVIDLANAGDGVSVSKAALKSNSYYQLAVACYDRWGRSFPIYTDARSTVSTLPMAKLAGNAPAIKWELNGKAPEGAESYQILISKNRTHQKTLYVNGIVNTENKSPDYVEFRINSLRNFTEAHSSSIISYDYTEGDRCTFVYKGEKEWFNTSVIDLEVVGFKMLKPENGDKVDFLLTVRKPDFDIATLADKNILLEVYTPKQREDAIGSGSDEISIFYEIGDRYPIVNGEYSVKTGDIKEGDVFLKTRQLENAVDPSKLDTYVVEDFNFSDFYQSNYDGYGRPRSYFDTPEDIRTGNSIVYSDTYVPFSKINLLHRFYPERTYGNQSGETSATYGVIRKIFQRDTTLLVFQDLKIGYVPVNTTILETADSQRSITISDKLLNHVRYAEGTNLCIGTAVESFAVGIDGIYFADPYNGEVGKVTLAGINSISGKMSSHFKKVLHHADKEKKKIIGIYDNFYNEYILSIEDNGSVVNELVFGESSWVALEENNPLANQITILQYPTNGTISYNSNTGIATYTPNKGYAGKDNFTFSFTKDGKTVTKRACIDVTLGKDGIYDFIFIDVSNAELNTVYESNPILITSNNIPVPISITGGEYSVNGGPFMVEASEVFPEDTVVVRLTSANQESTTSSATLSVAGYSDTFSVTTEAVVVPDDTTPNAFAFTGVSNRELSTFAESNTIIVSGVNVAVPVSIVGGEYSKNGGAYAAASTTAVNGDTFKVRLLTSSNYGTETSTTLTIGDTSATFTATTKSSITYKQITVRTTNNSGLFPTIELFDNTNNDSRLVYNGHTGSYPIEVVDDNNTLRLVVENFESVGVEVTVNGQTESMLPLTTVEFTLDKADVYITVTSFNQI